MMLRCVVTRFKMTLFVAMTHVAMILVAMAHALPAFGQTVLPPPTRSGAVTPATESATAPPTLTTTEAAPLTTGPDDGGAPMIWGNADYLLSWFSSVHIPTLVTTSPVGTAKGQTGILGGKLTQVVIGDQPLSGDMRSGFKLGLGGWVTPDKMIGVDVGYFMTESRANPFFASSDGSFILARPFIDATTGKRTSVIVASPGVSSGSVGVSANFGSFYGAHFDLQESIIENQHFRLKSLIGYRFLRVDDGLEIVQSISPTGGGFTPGTRLDARDAFAAQNEFHGCEVGFQTDFFYERWSLSFLGKFAVGRMYREVIISGDSTITTPGAAPVVQNGGVLALQSNIGLHSSIDWVGSPELATNLGYNVTDNLKLRVGYSLLLLFRAARAADQVDQVLNPNLFPPAVGGGARRPAFNLERSTLWLQTLNLGVELTF